ncbi:acyl carrier protein [Pendulispora albinea]|uniref:Acyl carrier protein n=1 Tax=Pendulispora albinea TaxID=2741071 RepID=A0ABZ2MAF6_9BACT
MDTIKAALTSFIVSQCLPGEAEENLPGDLDLNENGILDSMALLALVRFVEKEFHIEVDEHDIDGNFGTVNALAAYVAKKSQ